MTKKENTQNVIFDPTIKNQQTIQHMMDTLSSLQPAMQNMVNGLKKLTEWANDFTSNFDGMIKSLLDFSSKLAEISAPFVAITKFGDVQYVLWDRIPRDTFEHAREADDVNVFLQAYEGNNNYEKSDRLIQTCLNHPMLSDQKLVFKQTIASYKNSQYNLAALGFMTVTDNVLSQASGLKTHKAYERCKVILKKLKDNSTLGDKEFEIVTLYLTFQATFLSLYKPAPFDLDEPDDLNRHWIVHGRTKKELSRLDCIKLLNFLYGIILIDKMSKTPNDTKATDEGE